MNNVYALNGNTKLQNTKHWQCKKIVGEDIVKKYLVIETQRSIGKDTNRIKQIIM